MTATSNESTAPWDCPACQDGTRRVYPATMFSTDPDDINAHYMDDKSAKLYFDCPFDECPICGRAYGER